MTVRTGSTPADAVRAFGPLAAGVLLLGIADSMVGSYLVLYASEEVGLSPLQTGIFMSAPPVGSIVVSFLAGRRIDRHPRRIYAVLAALGGALGYAALTLTASFVLMLLIGALLLGAVGAVFPQLFTLARLTLGDGPAGLRAAPLLRSGWSLAWAAGPLLGAAIIAHGSYVVLLTTSAALLAVTAITILAVPRPPRPRPRDADSAPATSAVLPAAPVPLVLTTSIVLFFTAMYSGSVALPLYVTTDVHRPASDVGLLYSACAVVEVVAALALAAVPPRFSQKVLIVSAMAVFAGHFALTVAGTFELILMSQLARGVGIAVVGAAGIRFFQDISPAAVGRATTLFANASTGGALISGVLAGVSNQYLGYSATLVLSGGIALLAALLFTFARTERTTVATDGE